jgi:thymidylate synthase (FAD)
MVFIKPVFWAEYIRDDINSAYKDPLYDCWLESMQNTEIAYDYLIDNGASPQEARSVLPNNLKTEIVCTANLREWRHILKLRTAKNAHPQMRALMIPLLNELKQKLPVFFEDIVVE